MKRYVLFLNGRYRTADLPYFEKFLKSSRTVAVDNGYAFFKKTKRFPDILLGDFDSLPRVPKDLPQTTKMYSHPKQKDKSDTELALEFALGEGADRIDIVQPSVGDVDHFIANLMLLDLPSLKRRKGTRPKVRIIGRRYHLLLAVDETVTLYGVPGEILSVIPLSSEIRLSCTGTLYPARNIRIKRGEALPLRNAFSRRNATVEVTGQAFVVHLLHK
jgi:thiamine pyrophosphokinase